MDLFLLEKVVVAHKRQEYCRFFCKHGDGEKNDLQSELFSWG